MNVTKYEHACIVLEEEGKKLVIDPGSLTSTFGPLDNITAVVVTHMHADHFNPEHLQQIITASPDVQIFMPADAKARFGARQAVAVTGGEEKLVHPFTLKFFGELHAQAHPSMPAIMNTGVLVNDILFHPGDSFTNPGFTDLPLLALPGSAPWLKVGEAMDYLLAVRPLKCFMIHDAVLSEAGRGFHKAILQDTARSAGIEFTDLLPGDSLEC